MKPFIAASAGCLAILAISASASSADSDGVLAPTADSVATATPITHFMFLLQENHSFDNYFGTYSGADGIPDDVCMPVDPDDPTQGCVESFHIGNRAVTDLAHSPAIHEAEVNGGKMNGFVSAFGDTKSADIAMGYYDDRDLPFYWNVADNYVLFDRFFSSSKGGSVRNHMYWVSGQPGVEDKADAVPTNGWGDDIPTVFDELEAKGISWKFYIQNYDPTINIRSERVGDKGAQVVWAPVLAMDRFLDQPALANKIVDMSEYYSDLEAGTLPAVAFMVPSGSSEHPPGSIQAGQAFVRTLLSSLMRSSSWSSSAFLWSYDDWGGFYDHVLPPEVDRFGYGFRVPALLVSPYAKKGYVDSTVLDFTSGVAFIRENWGVSALADRDAAANTFMSAFDFQAPAREPVLLPGVRDVPQPKKANIAVLYPSYGMAVLLPVIFIVCGRRRIVARRSTTGAP